MFYKKLILVLSLLISTNCLASKRALDDPEESIRPTKQQRVESTISLADNDLLSRLPPEALDQMFSFHGVAISSPAVNRTLEEVRKRYIKDDAVCLDSFVRTCKYVAYIHSPAGQGLPFKTKHLTLSNMLISFDIVDDMISKHQNLISLKYLNCEFHVHPDGDTLYIPKNIQTLHIDSPWYIRDDVSDPDIFLIDETDFSSAAREVSIERYRPHPFPAMTELRLKNCLSNISVWPPMLPRAAPNLKRLILSDHYHDGDDKLLETVQGLSELTYLDISDSYAKGVPIQEILNYQQSQRPSLTIVYPSEDDQPEDQD